MMSSRWTYISAAVIPTISSPPAAFRYQRTAITSSAPSGRGMAVSREVAAHRQRALEPELFQFQQHLDITERIAGIAPFQAEEGVFEPVRSRAVLQDGIALFHVFGCHVIPLSGDYMALLINCVKVCRVLAPAVPSPPGKAFTYPWFCLLEGQVKPTTRRPPDIGIRARLRSRDIGLFECHTEPSSRAFDRSGSNLSRTSKPFPALPMPLEQEVGAVFNRLRRHDFPQMRELQVERAATLQHLKTPTRL